MSLPDRPSALIRAALEALEIQERKHVVRPGLWKEKVDTHVYLSLTGCVMVQNDLHYDTDTETWRKLCAIDCFERGNLFGAYSCLRGWSEPSIPNRVRVTPYNVDHKQFKNDLRGISDRLRLHGD